MAYYIDMIFQKATPYHDVDNYMRDIRNMYAWIHIAMHLYYGRN